MKPAKQASGERQGEPAPLLPDPLHRLGENELLVNEFFTSIQGESTYAGRPCFFIRLTGCHLRCTWCDTAYAFQEGTVATLSECVDRAKASGVPLVEVTGGEPLLQRACRPLLAMLADAGLEALLETSGTVPIAGMDPRVARIVDVKCPGSGMCARNIRLAKDLHAGDELKLVLVDRQDYDWAKSWLAAHASALPPGMPVHFSPAFGRLPASLLAGWIIADRLPVRLGLQIHKYIWEPDRRGT